MKLISGFIDPSMPLGSAGKKQLSITPSLHQETLYRPGRAVGNSDSKIKSCLDYNQCARPWQNDPSKLRTRRYAVGVCCWLHFLQFTIFLGTSVFVAFYRSILLSYLSIYFISLLWLCYFITYFIIYFVIYFLFILLITLLHIRLLWNIFCYFVIHFSICCLLVCLIVAGY